MLPPYIFQLISSFSSLYRRTSLTSAYGDWMPPASLGEVVEHLDVDFARRLHRLTQINILAGWQNKVRDF